MLPNIPRQATTQTKEELPLQEFGEDVGELAGGWNPDELQESLREDITKEMITNVDVFGFLGNDGVLGNKESW